MNNIYIICLAPAIDYILKLSELKINLTNRCETYDLYPAGKGVHVSMMFNNFNIKNQLLLFVNGSLENYFLSELQNNQVFYKNFKSKGEIRINIKLIDNNQTEISNAAAEIDDSEIQKMLDFLETNLKKDDFVILTGSIPKKVDKNIYAKICKLAAAKSAKAIVDAFSESLLKTLEYKPWLIKPNKDELKLTLKQDFQTQEEIVLAAKYLVSKGAENVIVSLGDRGSIFVNEEISYFCPIINSQYSVVNSAGAGDSMLAGFLANYLKTSNFKKALKFASISGTATAYSMRIASREFLENLLIQQDEQQIMEV